MSDPIDSGVLMRIFDPVLGRPVASRDELRIRVSSTNPSIGLFGPTRRDDQGRVKMHRGVDLLVTHGEPIYAAHDGMVARTGWENPNDPRQGFGLRIYLQGDGITTVYAHLEVIDVRVGDRIRAGEVIGAAGRSGNVPMGCPDHTHFEVRVDGNHVDPMGYLVGGVA